MMVQSKNRVLLWMLGAYLILAPGISAATKSWDNGGTDSNWEDDAGSAANWDNDTNPADFDDVQFTEASITANQVITVDDGAKTVSSILFSGQYSYSLNRAGKNDDIIFDTSGGAGGNSTLTVNDDSNHTIDADVITNNDLDITQNGSATLLFSRKLEIDNNSTLTIAGAGTVQFDDDLKDAKGSTGSVTKQGAGILIIDSKSNYSGGLTVDAGTVEFGDDKSAGTGTLTINGGTLKARNGARDIDGTVVVLGSFTIAGTLDFELSGSITVGGAGPHTLTTSNTGETRFSDVISGTQDLIKAGSETLILSGGSANTHSGTTTVNAGILDLDKGNGDTSIAGDLVIGDGSGTDEVELNSRDQIADTSDVTINSSGLFDLNGNDETIDALAMTGGSITTGAGTLTLGSNVTGSASSSQASVSGNLDVGGATRTFTIADGGADPDMAISAVISSAGSIIKAGDGNLQLSGVNTYTGTTTVRAGTLSVSVNAPDGSAGALGNAGSDIEIADSSSGSSDASLLIDTAGVDIARDVSVNNFGGTLSLGGSHGSGSSTFSGNVILDKDVTVTAASGGTVTFSGVISQTVSAELIKSGSGTVIFSGTSANTYTGPTTVNVGILQLNKTAGVDAIAGNLSIGDGTGTDEVELSASNQIADSSDVSLNTSGLFDLNGNDETIDALAMTGGSVTTGGGTLTLGNDITGNASTSSATISGNLNLGASTRTFTIADGTADPDMTISAIVSNGGLTKGGDGTLRLSGSSSNTYSGITTVNAGTLALNKSAGTDAIAGNLTIGDQSGTDIVRLDASNQFDTNSDILFNGGTLDLNGNSEADLGTVDVDFNSTIDFSGASGKITFDNSSAVSWATGVVIEVDNWAGSLSGNGSEELEVAGAGLTATQLGQVRFTNVATTISARDHHAVFSSGDANELVPLDSNEFVWDKDVTAGSWDTGTNWLAGHAPDSTLARAVFTESGLVGNVDVSGGSDVAFDLNRLIFRDTSTRTITVDSGNAYTLTFNNDSVDGPQIVVESGTGAKSVGSDIILKADLTIIHSVSSGDLTLSGAVSGANALTKAGAGTVKLSGTNSAFTGDVNVNAGTLQVENGSAVGNSATVTLANTSGAVFQTVSNETIGELAGGGASGGQVSLNASTTLTTGTATGGTYAGSITGSGNLIKQDSGTMVLTDLQGSSDYTGTSTVSDGVLEIEANTALGGSGSGQGTSVTSGASLTLDGIGLIIAEPLTLNGNGDSGNGALRYISTSGSGTSTVSGTVSLGSGSRVRVDDAGDNLVLSGVVSGSNALEKTGSGTLELQGTNTFSGTTTINNGVLRLDNSGGNALDATTPVTINSGGTLLFERANQVADTADLVLAGGTFSTAGFSESMDNLTLTATSTIDMGSGASILNFSDGTHSAGTFTVKNWSGNFTVGGGTDQIIFAASLDQAFLSKVFWNDLGKTGAKQLPSGEIVPIPEPSTVIGGIFLGLVVAGDICRRYRQRRRLE